MKILARGDDTYIVEMRTKELYRLIGYYSEYANGKPQIGIGDEIQVNAMYEQLYDLSNAWEQIIKAQGILNSIFRNLDKVKPVLNIVKDSGKK